LQHAEQLLEQPGVALLLGGEPELPSHQSGIFGVEGRPVGIEGGLPRGKGLLAPGIRRNIGIQRRQRLAQPGAVPQGHGGLPPEGVSALDVGVVADEPGVVPLEKSVGPVVERDPQDRHVVRVHHAMGEPLGDPPGHQAGGPLTDLGEEPYHPDRERLGGEHEIGRLLRDHVLEQLADPLRFAPGREEFEAAEPHVTGCEAEQGGRGFGLFPLNRQVASGDPERPGRWNAEPGECLAGEILPDRRTQDGATVAKPGEPGATGALEMQIPALPSGIHHLAEQNGATIPELGHPDAELVAGVRLRDRLRAGQPEVPRQQRRELITIDASGIQIEQDSRVGIESDEIRLGQGSGVDHLVKGGMEPRVGVVEDQRVEIRHAMRR